MIKPSGYPLSQKVLLKFGLAGLGRFGLLQAAVISQLPGVELTSIADPDVNARENFIHQYGKVRTYEDCLDLIADRELDALVLVTPDEQHSEQVLAAVQGGRAVFVEKPLARTWKESCLLWQEAQAQNSYLQVGLLLRYDLSHRLLQEEIKKGHFGELVSIRCQRNCSQSSFPHIANRVHTVYRTLLHDIDLVLWLTGSKVNRVMATEFRKGDFLYPQGCFALLKMKNGCVVQLESSWYVPSQAPANVLNGTGGGCIDAELAVVGTRKTAKIRWLDGGMQVWSDQRVQTPDTTLWPEISGRVHGALGEQIRDFAQSVRLGEPSEIASIDDAIEGLRVAEAIVEAAATGRVIDLF